MTHLNISENVFLNSPNRVKPLTYTNKINDFKINVDEALFMKAQNYLFSFIKCNELSTYLIRVSNRLWIGWSVLM